jgi:hypothetical protein
MIRRSASPSSINNSNKNSLLLSPLLRLQSRTIIFSTYASTVLEEAATKKGYKSPFWLDFETLNNAKMNNNRLYPSTGHFGTLKSINVRQGEQPTRVMLQREVALYNLDQLRPGPKGLELMTRLPKAVDFPIDVSNNQPFRGALASNLQTVSTNKNWGQYWIQSSFIKKSGFMFPRLGQWEPSGWKSTVTAFQLLNFDQLDSSAIGIDLATVPINFRYATFFLGSETAEVLRNEAMRRDLKYCVTTTSKMIEVCGCSVLPEKIQGFLPPNLNNDNNNNFNQNENQNNNNLGGNRFNNYNKPYFNNNNSFNNNYNKYKKNFLEVPLFNLDEMNVGATEICGTLNISDPSVYDEVPTFLFTMKPIQRQLVLNETESREQQIEKAEVLPLDEENNNKNENDQQQQQEEKQQKNNFLVDGKFTTNLWVRESEALQLSKGVWKPKPGAKGAMLGNSVGFLRQQQELQQSSAAEGTGDLTQMNTNITNFASNQSYFANSSYQQQQSTFTMNPYYFDADVKERQAFLACLGKYCI